MELRLVRHGVVDSTNERAFAALAAGTARHGDLHVASGQTAGRGRRGRPWRSTPDEGLYASLVLLPPPPGPPPAVLTVAAGLAVLDAVEALGVHGARLKWPNDVLVGEAKLSGILVEARGLDPQHPHFVVGVGLNVAQREFPPELLAEREVTSLHLLGVDVGLEVALDGVLVRLASRLSAPAEDLARLSSEYLERSRLAGAWCRARTPSGQWDGRIRSLDLGTSRLILETSEAPLALRLEHLTGLERLTGPGN